MTTIEELEARFDHKFELMKLIYDTRLADQAEEIARLSDQVASLMQRPPITGTFPPIHEIDKLQIQIFHTTDLTPNQRRGGNTEWSFRFEYWHRGKMQPPINIALHDPTKFLRLLQSKADTPGEILGCAQDMCREDVAIKTLGGIVKCKLPGGGAEYRCDQVAIIGGHLSHIDQVVVLLQIGTGQIQIDNFKPANGAKSGHAKWFGKWTRKASTL